MLTAATAEAVEVSLHTGDPGTTGGSEVSGGEYARQAVTWNAPSGGAVQASEELEFSVPSLGSGEVTHVGLWTSTGVWLGSIPASVPQPYPTPGSATVAPLVLDMSTGVMVATMVAK